MASNLFQELTAPNGHTYSQPLGLFINNQWRAAKSGELITVVNPTYGNFRPKCSRYGTEGPANWGVNAATRLRLPKSTPVALRMSTTRSRPPATRSEDRGLKFPAPNGAG